MTRVFALLQFMYWFLFGVSYAFANPVLDAKGFSVSNIGIILSLSALIAVIFQPILAKMINEFENIDNKKVILFLMSIILSGLLFSLIIENLIIVSIVYILIFGSILTVQTFIYTFIFEYINCGYNVNFALTRGLGSFAFACASLGIGYLTKNYGFSFMVYLELVITIVIIIHVYKIKSVNFEVKKVEKDTKDLNFIEFIKKYNKFSLFLVGAIFIFITHMALNNFLLNIMQHVGKSTFYVGLAYSISALLELPIMALFPYLKKKIGTYNILFFSIIAFTIKSAIVFVGILTKSISIVMFSQFTQIFAFAIYLPTVIYYVNDVMDERDKIKGQAYLGSAGTVSTILSSFIGAGLIDISGVTMMVLVVTIISLIGTVIVCRNLERD